MRNGCCARSTSATFFVLLLLACASCKDTGLIGTEELGCIPACADDLTCDPALSMCRASECSDSGCVDGGAPLAEGGAALCEGAACAECRDTGDCQDGGACIGARCTACTSDSDCGGDDDALICREGRCMEDDEDDDDEEEQSESGSSDDI